MFRNCSTVSRGDFMSNSSLAGSRTRSDAFESKGESRLSKMIKIKEKQNEVESNWGKVDRFRIAHEMTGQSISLARDRRIKTILERVERRRPLTAGAPLTTRN